MKAQKKINIVMFVLIIILVSIISFVGIYYQSANQMKNLLPDYKLGTNLKGYRRVTLDLKSSTSSDANSTNETTANESADNTTNSTNTTESSTEDNTPENYSKCATILKNRFKKLNIEDYNITCDQNTGKIDVSIPDNDQTDTILSDIAQKGVFTITDSDTNEVLLSNDDIKNVEVKTTTSGTSTSITMNINFNIQGTNKFKKVTASYQNFTNTSTEADTNETTNTSNDTNATDETNSTNTTSSTSSSSSKKVILKIDDTTMMTTNFSEVIDNGTLALTINTSSTSTTDTSTFKDKLYGAYNLAAIIENDAMPVQYEVTGNTYVASQVNQNGINLIIYIEIGIALIIALYMIVRYRGNGILAVISSIGFVALLLIALRYGNVALSIEGLFAIEIAYILNMVFNSILCRKLEVKDLTNKERIKEYKNSIKKFVLSEIPILILATVCCFSTWNTIFSFGMVIFWGTLISTFYNMLVAYMLVKTTNK